MDLVKKLWKQEPVRVVLYTLSGIVLAALVSKGVVDQSLSDSVAGVIAAVLGVGAAEGVRSQVSPAE